MPKISSGIPKKFLTPCRRLGLSRLRKTPKTPLLNLNLPSSNDESPLQSPGSPLVDWNVSRGSEESPLKTPVPKSNPASSSEAPATLIEAETITSTPINNRKEATKRKSRNLLTSSNVDETPPPPPKKRRQRGDEEETPSTKPHIEETPIKKTEISEETGPVSGCAVVLEEKHDDSKRKRISKKLYESDDDEKENPMKAKISPKPKNGAKKLRAKKENIPEKVDAQRQVQSERNQPKIQTILITKKPNSGYRISQGKNKVGENKIKKADEKIISNEGKKDECNTNIPTAKLDIIDMKTAIKSALKAKDENLPLKIFKSKAALKYMSPIRSSPRAEGLNDSLASSLSDETPLNVLKNNTAVPTNKPIPLRRTLSLKKVNSSTSVTDFEDAMIDWYANDANEMHKQLVKDVDLRKRKLAELEQVKIYRNKHKVEDLEQLTQVWMEGCSAALNDILWQVNHDGAMNMELLMRKLNIPQPIIGKLMLTICKSPVSGELVIDEDR